MTTMIHDAVGTVLTSDPKPFYEEVYITKYALDKTIGVYKVTGVVHSSNGTFTRNGTLYIHDEWHRTEKEALTKVKAMARKAMKRLMREHNHAESIVTNARDGRLPASRNP